MKRISGGFFLFGFCVCLFVWFFTFLFLWRQGFNSIDKLLVIQRFFSWLWEPGCNSNKNICGLHPGRRMWAARSKCMGQYQFRGRSPSTHSLEMFPAKSCNEWRTLFLVAEMEPMHSKNASCFGAFTAFSSGGFFFQVNIFQLFFVIFNKLFQESHWSDWTLWSLRKILVTANIIYTSNICMGRHYKSLMYVLQKLLISFWAYFISRCYMGTICSPDWCGKCSF